MTKKKWVLSIRVFGIFVINKAWQNPQTLYYHITEFQIFWSCRTNSCWWLISSLLQIHEIVECPWHTPISPYNSSHRMVSDLCLYIEDPNFFLKNHGLSMKRKLDWNQDKNKHKKGKNWPYYVSRDKTRTCFFLFLFSLKSDSIWGWKLHYFATKTDAQPCNVS